MRIVFTNKIEKISSSDCQAKSSALLGNVENIFCYRKNSITLSYDCKAESSTLGAENLNIERHNGKNDILIIFFMLKIIVCL